MRSKHYVHTFGGRAYSITSNSLEDANLEAKANVALIRGLSRGHIDQGYALIGPFSSRDAAYREAIEIYSMEQVMLTSEYYSVGQMMMTNEDPEENGAYYGLSQGGRVLADAAWNRVHMPRTRESSGIQFGSYSRSMHRSGKVPVHGGQR